MHQTDLATPHAIRRLQQRFNLTPTDAQLAQIIDQIESGAAPLQGGRLHGKRRYHNVILPNGRRTCAVFDPVARRLITFYPEHAISPSIWALRRATTCPKNGGWDSDIPPPPKRKRPTHSRERSKGRRQSHHEP